MDVAAGPSEGLPLDADGVVAVNPFQLRGSGALGDSRELLELNLLLPGGDKGQVLDLRCLGPVELVELDSVRVEKIPEYLMLRFGKAVRA